MEVAERRDGLTQARRCLEAMAGQDFDTQRSLWRAAVKFHRRDKDLAQEIPCRVDLLGRAMP